MVTARSSAGLSSLVCTVSYSMPPTRAAYGRIFQPDVQKVLAGRGDEADAVVAREVLVDLGAASRLAGLSKVLEDGREGALAALGQVAVDGIERRLHRLPRRGAVDQVHVDRAEEVGVQLQRLRNHLAVGELARPDHLHAGQGRCRVKDPQHGVVEIAARDHPLVSFVNRLQRVDRGGEKLQAGIALADVRQAVAQVADRFVVGVEKAPLRQQRVHEGVVGRPLDDLAKAGPRHQERVHVDPVGVQRHVPAGYQLVVDRDQPQIDVRAGPDGVVREAAAQDRRQDRPILLEILDQPVERARKVAANEVVRHPGNGSPPASGAARGARSLAL